MIWIIRMWKLRMSKYAFRYLVVCIKPSLFYYWKQISNILNQLTEFWYWCLLMWLYLLSWLYESNKVSTANLRRVTTGHEKIVWRDVFEQFLLLVKYKLTIWRLIRHFLAKEDVVYVWHSFIHLKCKYGNFFKVFYVALYVRWLTSKRWMAWQLIYKCFPARCFIYLYQEDIHHLLSCQMDMIFKGTYTSLPFYLFAWIIQFLCLMCSYFSPKLNEY